MDRPLRLTLDHVVKQAVQKRALKNKHFYPCKDDVMVSRDPGVLAKVLKQGVLR